MPISFSVLRYKKITILNKTFNKNIQQPPDRKYFEWKTLVFRSLNQIFYFSDAACNLEIWCNREHHLAQPQTLRTFLRISLYRQLPVDCLKTAILASLTLQLCFHDSHF